MHLIHGLLSPYNARDCLGVSSTDNFPKEPIENTLEPVDRVEIDCLTGPAGVRGLIYIGFFWIYVTLMKSRFIHSKVLVTGHYCNTAV